MPRSILPGATVGCVAWCSPPGHFRGRGDAPQAETLLEGLRTDHVLADAAYDSDAIRKAIRKMKAKACIKPNPTQKTQEALRPQAV